MARKKPQVTVAASFAVAGAPPEAPPIYKSEGQRLLCETPGAHTELGDALGVPKQSIHQWRTGEITPGTKARERIAATYGIDASAWERLPRGSAPPTDDDDNDDSDDDETDDAEPSLADDYREQLQELRKQLKRPDLLVRDRLALNDAFGKALERRRKYELQHEMLEDRIVRAHPAWRRLKKLLTDALLAHPEAARDVEQAIETALGKEGL